ncbi:hypothetical protein [Micromonospora sp. NPDC005806]|uniref:hypothetical protein n=1 Tax=Micromonospora sp. NPDC005806 TaxID=3364234 RepID=UPI0036D12698
MSVLTETDERHLRRAIALAAAARDAGDGPFGSLLVDAGGRVLAEEDRRQHPPKFLYNGL